MMEQLIPNLMLNSAVQTALRAAPARVTCPPSVTTHTAKRTRDPVAAERAKLRKLQALQTAADRLVNDGFAQL